jgi:transposase
MPDGREAPMRREHVIALDVHCQFTEIAVLTAGGRISKREQCPTSIPALAEAITSVRRPRDLVFEEGPLADWLLRNLGEHVDAVTVCDPRRNHLIAKDSDKDDPIDAEKLGQLYRGGYVKRVHHPESFDRMVFKRHVGLYHDRVRNRVRQANRIIAELRQYGIFVRERAFAQGPQRQKLLERLPKQPVVRADLRCLWQGYDAATEQEATMEHALTKQAKREPQIRRFAALPGILWIRAATFFAYVDTPWRFRGKSALWKYLGIGLERRHSGAGPEQLHVPWQVNRRLKYTILGAAMSAVAARDNPFAEQYERWIDEGLTPRIARRNVARSQAAVMWGMWKTGSVYRPEVVGVAAAAQAEKVLETDRRIMRRRRSSQGGIRPRRSAKSLGA